MGTMSLSFSAALGAAGGITLGMVLERAGGWRSLTDFVETKGYSLDTLQTLYIDKLKPSFKSIFPSRSTEVDQPLAAEMVAADADTKRCPVPAFMIKDYVIPLTGGKTISGVTVVLAGTSIGMSYAAYKVTVRIVGQQKMDSYVEKVRRELSTVGAITVAKAKQVSDGAAVVVMAAYADTAARAATTYQCTSRKVAAAAEGVYEKSGMRPRVERAAVAVEPLTTFIRLHLKTIQAETVRRLGPTAAAVQAEADAKARLLLSFATAAATSARHSASLALTKAQAVEKKASAAVLTTLAAQKQKALLSAGNALTNAGMRLKGAEEPEAASPTNTPPPLPPPPPPAPAPFTLTRDVEAFLLDLRADLAQSVDREALEAKYPSLLHDLDALKAGVASV